MDLPKGRELREKLWCGNGFKGPFDIPFEKLEGAFEIQKMLIDSFD